MKRNDQEKMKEMKKLLLRSEQRIMYAEIRAYTPQTVP